MGDCMQKTMKKTVMDTNVGEYRKSEYNINKILINRWSPRAMTGEKISKNELMTLFEAARWAPSSYNGQPWRFVYAERETEHWERLFNLLVDFNKMWCSNAAVLFCLVSRKTFEHNNNPSVTHSFDCGSAWENMALQGSMMGLVVHGMEGFNYEKARKDLKIPENYHVEMMGAIGKPAGVESLPDALQKKELPSGRKNLLEIIMEGQFKR